MENTEDFVRRGKAKVATGAQMDKRVLDDSFAAMDVALGKTLQSTVLAILKGRALKVAAAAAVLLALGLLATQLRPSRQALPPIAKTARPRAELASVMSLNMAYRRGGIEALDDLSREVFQRTGPRPTQGAVRELLMESNGV